jgi:cobalt-zinc-cadmium efflux system protein
VIVVALVGVAVNASSAALFMAGRHGDLNVRSAFLHLASDAALALSVAVAGVVMIFTGWWWLDPVMSILLSLVILGSTLSLLRDSLDLVLHAVPAGIEPDAVRAYLGGLPGVLQVHDLHIWAMSTTETALTAHLVMADASSKPAFLGEVCRQLHDRFDIEHSTLQVECPEAPSPCRLAPEEAI